MQILKDRLAECVRTEGVNYVENCEQVWLPCWMVLERHTVERRSLLSCTHCSSARSCCYAPTYMPVSTQPLFSQPASTRYMQANNPPLCPPAAGQTL